MTRARVFRLHAWVFAIVGIGLSAANAMSAGPWWTFWLLGAWALLFGVHYLAHKTRTVDEAWVAERTDDVRSKSYDASHIDTIRKDAPP